MAGDNFIRFVIITYTVLGCVLLGWSLFPFDFPIYGKLGFVLLGIGLGEKVTRAALRA